MIHAKPTHQQIADMRTAKVKNYEATLIEFNRWTNRWVFIRIFLIFTTSPDGNLKLWASHGLRDFWAPRMRDRYHRTNKYPKISIVLHV